MEAGSEKLPKSFLWLNATQFLGALNDNIFKLLVALSLIALLGNKNTSKIMAISGAIFVTPFLLFSHFGGVLADRFSKRNIIVFTKVLEIVVMLFGTFAFLYKNPIGLYTTLFLMGMQSALFGPSKYGIVPELVAMQKLSKANSLLTSFTFLAIILGTFFAPFITQIFSHNFTFSSIVCIIIAVIGTVTSIRILRTPPQYSKRSFTPLFILDIWRTLYGLRKDRYLLLTVIASAYFMLIGAFLQFNIIPFGVEILHLNEVKSGYLFLVAAIGIGSGSLFAGKLSGRNIEFGIVPLGALGLTFACMIVYFIPYTLVNTILMLLMMGISAGLFIVPIESYIQYRSPVERRGEILATSNFLGFAGVFIAAGLLYIFSEIFKLSPAQGFFAIGCITLVLTIFTLIELPDFFIRFIALLIMRLCYRIKIVGAENVPTKGPAMLICNHVSWIDALLLSATQQRRIRFVMYREFYDISYLKPFFKLMGVIPISFKDPPKILLQSIEEIRTVLSEGYIVCLFAEGSITRTGNLRKFDRGFERILKGTNYPIIPAYIGGGWGSILSYYHGKVLSKFPSIQPYSITILFGKPMSATSSVGEVRLAVMELAGNSFDIGKPKRRSLASMFVSMARKNWFRKAISDTTGKRLTFGKTLTAAVALSEKLKSSTENEEKVGVLLPASVGGAVTNIAITLLKKVPVNLNFTSSSESIQSAIKQCDIKTIISSHTFLEKLKNLAIPEGIIYLEDIYKSIAPKDMMRALLKALFMPNAIITNSSNFSADDLATVIFSSGCTGEPKGVLLSHHNIISNIESFRMVLNISPKDNVCAALPFFHSFGFTTTLWLPLISGFSTCYHPNPLDGAAIAKVVRKNKSTILLATPTFLTIYTRAAAKEDFTSLRMVIVGAEKLKKRISDAFEQKFGIRPLEGYGATELSPVTSVNLPDVEIDGVYQVGTKDDSVGHPIPGVSVKIVDIETGKTLPFGKPGLLYVKGPNVMLGYLNQPEKTKEVLKDGWYNTGDIAFMDMDGFVTITDRLSRFSKIGGEMVPHLAIEEEYYKKLDTTNQVLAVTAVPDEKKGENLIVLYTDEAGNSETLHRIISESTLPNLWKPRPENYFKVDSLPLLGSGKLDIKCVKELAVKAVANDN